MNPERIKGQTVSCKSCQGGVLSFFNLFFLARVGLQELEEKFTYFQTQMEERAAKSANLSPTVEER